MEAKLIQTACMLRDACKVSAEACMETRAAAGTCRRTKQKKMETFEGLHALEAELAKTLCVASGSFNVNDEAAWRPEQLWAQAREHAKNIETSECLCALEAR